MTHPVSEDLALGQTSDYRLRLYQIIQPTIWERILLIIFEPEQESPIGKPVNPQISPWDGPRDVILKGGKNTPNNYSPKITGTFYPYQISNTTNTEMHA